jgi:cbb3-type cytochrome oxidase maturation protein
MFEFFFLIPISIILGLAGLGFFLWALRDGQYDDLKGDAERILNAEDRPRLNTSVRTGSSAPPPPDETAP